MGKRLILLTFMVMSLTAALAEDKWGGYIPDSLATGVQLHPGIDYGDNSKDHHAPARLPQLAYEGNTFVLAVPYALEDVTIVVRDMDGAVLYCSYWCHC